MSKKTKIGSISTTVVILFIMIFMAVQSFASGTTKYLGIVGAREGDETYEITNIDLDAYPGLTSSKKTIWKLVNYDSLDDSATANYDEAIYCINPEIGFVRNDAGSRKATYNVSFNMKDLSNVEQKYKDMFVLMYGADWNQRYNAMLWILDNIYLPKQTSYITQGSEEISEDVIKAAKEALLKAAGIDRDVLTDNDIEVIQQMALWYFPKDDSTYHYELNGNEDVLPAIALNETSIDEIGQPVSNEGKQRKADMNKLYRYLVSSAISKQASYGTRDVRELEEPEIEFTSPEDNTITSIEKINQTEYFIAGPFHINEKNNSQLTYTIVGDIYNQNDAKITDYILLDSTKTELATTNIDNSLIGEDFYIAVPTENTEVSKIILNVKMNYFTTNVTVWTNSDTYNNEQPVVIVEKEPHEVEISKEVVVKRPIFDLALRKFITKINGQAVDTSRDPNNEANNIDISKILDGSDTTATYTHPKDVLSVRSGDIVTYTIRVYNEGEISGYAKEITDHIPEGLEYIVDDTINIEYKWKLSDDGTKITTNYLSLESDDANLINAFDRNTMTELDYKDVEVVFKVVEPDASDRVLVNIAEISSATDSEGNAVIDINTTPNMVDRDSVPNNVDKNNYNPPADNSSYQEDDDDYEQLKLNHYDLALRKFITEVNGVSVASREPQVDLTKLIAGTETTATYTHPKTPVSVKNGDKVVYTIRVYNEGKVDGTATQITDYIPEGLKFIPASESTINANYGWIVSVDGKVATTDAMARSGVLISAFDKTQPNPTLSYQDVKIELEVVEPNTSERILRNIAEITADDDNDIDSVPNNVDKDNYNPPLDNSSYQEDDDDYEELKLEYFDLSLRKYISKINDTQIVSREPQVDVTGLIDGSTTTATYTHPKTPVGVVSGARIVYTIRVYNEGKIDGIVKEITDYVPDGLRFIPSEESEINREYKWTKTEENIIKTDYLKDTTIKAFDKVTGKIDSKYVLIEFEVIEPSTSNRVLRNIAEITDDNNDDVDSVPNNVDKDNYNPPADNSSYQEDDDDYEEINLQYFDLALRKFITKVNETEITNRIPNVDVTGLLDETSTTATYTHTKTPLLVRKGDRVTYTIRVYNEGKIDGTATEIVDYIPEGLKFLENSSVNTAYGWTLSDDKTEIRTNYLANETIVAFNKDTSVLDYKDILVEFEVIESNSSDRVLTNIAEIAEDTAEDIDSSPDDKEPGQDDIDEEHLILENYDLSLRKFITNVDGKEITTRIPNVDISKLLDGTAETATYTHPKDPVVVKTGDKVVYTIRVYNEGKIDGFAKKITDYVPEGLKYVENSKINKLYKWVISADGKTVSTNYLKDTRIKALDKTAENPTLDYKDVLIEFEVIEPAGSDKVLRNIAEIASESNDDRDSVPNNVDINNYNPPADNSSYQEDDDDYEQITLEKNFDLSLRKFITSVDGKEITTRIPNVDVTKLKDGNDTTATYTHPKDPIRVKTGNIVTYTIRIYNEGNVDGTATEIVDYVPEGLKYVENSSINDTYKWVVSNDGREIRTRYLEGKVIKAFDKNGTTLNYKDVLVEFEVIEPNTSNKVLTNLAEIADDTDDDGDSIPDNKTSGEDDIDEEHVILGYFDLSLRKFITKVNSDDIDTRYPTVTTDKDGKIIYTHPKDPVMVANNDIVVYTIRVYNEGTIAGFAKEISDDIPYGLAYLPEHEINKKYGWVLSNDGKTVSTDYLSKEKSDERGEDNLLKAFNKDNEISDNNPDYRDVQIAFKVTESNLASNRVIINTAEITDDSDENGYDVIDEDSIPNNNVPGEDDIDNEYLKVRYFDLSLLKWVTKTYVTENGKTTVHETGHTGLENPEPTVKVDLDRKNINKVTVKFEYTIKVTNEGEIAGYAKEISDYIPKGLKFVKADNPDWEEKNGKIVTRKLENTLLKPGESATVKVILTWINDGNNMGLKVNVAEISEDYNEKGSKDIDSIPNNKKDGEDDIDDAPVILTVKTGIEQTYTVLVLSILIALTAGIIVIKKTVLR